MSPTIDVRKELLLYAYNGQNKLTWKRNAFDTRVCSSGSWGPLVLSSLRSWRYCVVVE